MRTTIRNVGRPIALTALLTVLALLGACTSTEVEPRDQAGLRGGGARAGWRPGRAGEGAAGLSRGPGLRRGDPGRPGRTGDAVTNLKDRGREFPERRSGRAADRRVPGLRHHHAGYRHRHRESVRHRGGTDLAGGGITLRVNPCNSKGRWASTPTTS